MQVYHTLADMPDRSPTPESYDVVVVGAGGAGLAAALFAAIEGKKVLMVESTPYVGGTTALSAGTTWIPLTHHAHHAAAVNPSDLSNPPDTLTAAAQYLNHAVGDRSPAALRQAFLDSGAAAVALLEAQTEVKFRPYPKHPDYLSELPGSTLCGRALEPLPFDGRLLGALFKLIRPPIPEFTVLGGMMVDRTDINHLLGMTQSLVSLKHVLKIVTRHAFDRLRYPRGTRLVMGNALVGRLLYSLSQRTNVSLVLNASVAAMSGTEVTLQPTNAPNPALHRTFPVRSGVILASGGFNRHAGLRSKMLGNIDPDWCPAAPGHTGKAQALALDLGAHYGEVMPAADATHAFWAPVSLRKRPDGTGAVFPHFVMDRAKPGMLTVNSAGQRFVNESTSYHLFALAMQQSGAVPAFLICDARALRQYGMGMVRPGATGLQAFLDDGYLVQGATLAELAGKLGIAGDALQATVTRFNGFAASGIDLDFQRGTTAYQQNIGDASWTGPNPNLGALNEAPFYAVRLYPGDIGASTGLATDTHARVLQADGQPIEGLYAVGNDMHSIMGGVYTAPGITIGPGIVFGYRAAQHASAQSVP